MKHRLRYILALVLALAALLGWLAAAHPDGLREAFGVWPVPQGTPWTYQLWSGFVPALTVLTLIGSVASLYHVHNCHYGGCLRLGKHKIGGTPWCTRHKQYGKPVRTAEDLLEQLVILLSEPGQRGRRR